MTINRSGAGRCAARSSGLALVRGRWHLQASRADSPETLGRDGPRNPEQFQARDENGDAAARNHGLVGVALPCHSFNFLIPTRIADIIWTP
jgi:hypothetical protein